MGKKSLRTSTTAKSQDTEKKRKEREELKEQMLKEYARKRNVAAVRRLTQEELLEEAKITEEINTRSLGLYSLRPAQDLIAIIEYLLAHCVPHISELFKKMELEKKKARCVKQVYRGPTIRYHSYRVKLSDSSDKTYVQHNFCWSTNS